MKKILIAIMLMAGLSASAQTDHLTFKGIPIDGNLNTFVSKLKQKGLSHMGTKQGVAIFEGEFAAFKDCHIAVYEQSGLVYQVCVVFPIRDSWATIHSDYSRLKDMLSQKYGGPIYEEESWQGESEPQDDHERMYELKMNRCNYKCVWDGKNGTIVLAISSDLQAAVLVYGDSANLSKVQSDAMEDL